jgi:hypothetical protein
MMGEKSRQRHTTSIVSKKAKAAS